MTTVSTVEPSMVTGSETIASAPPSIPWREKLAYSSAQIGGNLQFGLISGFLLFFYTDVFGISAAAAAGLLAFARLWDAINDPLVGMLIDRTNTRWGRFKPFILFGSLPTALTFVLIFFTPDLSPGAKLVYAYVTYFLFDTLNTLSGTPVNAMLPSLTQNPRDRVHISTVNGIFALVGGVAAAIGVPLLTVALGGGDPARGWLMVASIIAVVGIVTNLLVVFGTKERLPVAANKAVDGVRGGLMANLRPILGNTPFLIVCMLLIAIQCGIGIRSATGLYYFTYIVGDPTLAALTGLPTLIGLLGGTALTPLAVRLFGRKRVILAGTVVSALGSAGIWFAGNNLTWFVVCSGISLFGAAFMLTLVNPLLADSVDYGAWKSGVRADGLMYSLYFMGQKFSLLITSVITAGVLSLTGYVANVEQTPLALNGIILLNSLIPALLTLVGLVMFFYKLDAKTMSTVTAELAARREAAERSA